MSQFHKELQMYAENGLRSADDWMSSGRKVNDGAKPKANVTCRGQDYQLFTRDQTEIRHSKRRRLVDGAV
ncbi:MAG TPA: hypothetical protein VL992_01475 [Tepidisphaeraceae bacterium]|nr:hypothetical protein [Tepidisphaeraceae bacterium]